MRYNYTEYNYYVFPAKGAAYEKKAYCNIRSYGYFIRHMAQSGCQVG
jgi:hypothetical protein